MDQNTLGNYEGIQVIYLLDWLENRRRFMQSL